MSDMGGLLGGLGDWFRKQGAFQGMNTAEVDPMTGMAKRKNFKDIMSNPFLKLGLGLMEQGGPQSKPHSFGQDLSRAVGGMQQGEEDDQARQMRQMQLEQMRKQQEMASKWFADQYGSYNGGMGGGGPQAMTPPSNKLPQWG